MTKSLTLRQRTYGRGRLFRKRRDGVAYGAFLMEFYVGGKQRTESTRTTDLADATRMLNARLGTVAAGTAPAAGLGRVTVADLLDDLESRHEVELAPSLRTTRTHGVALRAALGTIRAADLTTKHLERFVAACRRPGAKGPGARYAEATIGRYLDTLKAALNLGREATPPKVATLPKFPTIDESGNVRQGFATVAQIDVILETLRMRDGDLADAVEWAFFTGMRKGAVAGLEWAAWDAETATLRLPPAGRKKQTPKALPLRAGHPLRAILDRRWERRKERARDTGRLEALIFWRVHRGAPRPGLRPGDAVPVYEYRKAWATACRAAGVPALLVHDLRRTAVRNAWKATRDLRLVKLLSGHATDSMATRYNIDAGDELAPALDAIAAFVEAQPRGERPAVPTLPRRPRRRAKG
jgi:integrase